jgi:hypothetical protein
MVGSLVVFIVTKTEDKKTRKTGRIKSLWNGESWDIVECKEYRVSEENEKSKEIQRNRLVKITGQEKEIGQGKRTTVGKLMGLAMPPLNINIELMGLAMSPLIFSFLLILFNEPTYKR